MLLSYNLRVIHDAILFMEMSQHALYRHGVAALVLDQHHLAATKR